VDFLSYGYSAVVGRVPLFYFKGDDIVENNTSKTVSKLMGHAKEIITIDVYGDNKEMTAEGIPELETFMEEVMPKQEEQVRFREDLLDIEIDVREYLPAS
jgi:hypothetical protein